MRRRALPLVGVVLALALWEAAVRLIDNPGLFPPLSRIAAAAGRWQASGLMATDVAESVPRALVALALATPSGIALGLALAMSRRLHSLLDGLIQFGRCLPPVALLPLFVLWFGIGWWAKVGAAAFVCLFPIMVTTVGGARTADRAYRELAADLGLSPLRYTRGVVLPAALPTIVPGVRLALGTSFVMVFVSELAGASAGLGYRINVAQLAFQADLMVAALVTLGVIGLATDAAIAAAAGRILHYAGR